jgi:tetratricopeptide (TPR) repeat protein
MTNELPSVIDRQVAKLCAEGRVHVVARRFDAAVLSYKAAFDLLPKPKERWRSTSEILASITDACFLKGDFQKARDPLDAVRECSHAALDPAFHLRLGKVLYEMGDIEQAGEELIQAYEQGGEPLFASEDPKYLRLVLDIR